jgi:hypothetical protein
MFLPSNEGTKYVYIDECGNFGTDLTKEGNSSHFIITAIVVEEYDVEKLKQAIKIIQEKYFPNGEIKSSRISNKNHYRRLTILKEIADLKFNIIILVVDKHKIKFDSTGLKYKKTYYKYLNRLLYKELKLLYPNLIVKADNHGDDKFMNEFGKYVNSKESISLFDKFLFEFADSKEEPLIQLADFISGTISYGFENDKICNEYKEFYELIKSKILVLRQWPTTYENYMQNLEVVDIGKYDKKIAEHCIRAATKYIKEHDNSKDPIENDRIHILQLLLNQIYAYDPDTYVFSNELIELLNKTKKEKYDKRLFMNQIIAHLRDNNVIISSSSNGYKIPVSEKELYSYTNKTLGQVIPQLERLNSARQRIKAITENQLDILDTIEYHKLKKYFND